jgi:hypothetical protein
MSAIQQRATCTRSNIQGAPTSCRLPVEGHPVPHLPAYKPTGQNIRQPTARNTHALQHARAPSCKERRHSVGCRSRDILSRISPHTNPPAKTSTIRSAQHARALSIRARGGFLLPHIHVVSAMPVLGDLHDIVRHRDGVEPAAFNDQEIDAIDCAHFHFQCLVVVHPHEHVA